MSIDRANLRIDWAQAALNGGNYCFHVQDGERFCGRGDRWAGHHDTAFSGYHPFRKAGAIVADLEAAQWTVTQVARLARRLEDRIVGLQMDVAFAVERRACLGKSDPGGRHLVWIETNDDGEEVGTAHVEIPDLTPESICNGIRSLRTQP